MSDEQPKKVENIKKENGAQAENPPLFDQLQSTIVIKQRGGQIEVASSLSLSSWPARAILREALKLAEAKGVEAENKQPPNGEAAEG